MRGAQRMDGLYGTDETNGTLPSSLIGPISPIRPILGRDPELTQRRRFRVDRPLLLQNATDL